MTKKKQYKKKVQTICDEVAENLFSEYIEKENELASSSQDFFLESCSNVKILSKKNTFDYSTVSHKKIPKQEKKIISFYVKDDLTLIKNAPSHVQVTLESMKKRDFPFKSQLDLHGMRIKAAQSVLIPFIQQVYIQGKQEVLLITGKGNNSPQGVAIIRESVLKWLTQYPLNLVVLGFTSPSRYLGGEGALGVLLRSFDALLKISWHHYSVERE